MTEAIAVAACLVILLISGVFLFVAAIAHKDAKSMRNEAEADKQWADQRHTEAAQAEERAERAKAETLAELDAVGMREVRHG